MSVPPRLAPSPVDAPSRRRAPGLAACFALAAGAALAGLALRLLVPPSLPAGGADAAYRHFEQIRDGLPPAKVRQIEEVWRRLERAGQPPNP